MNLADYDLKYQTTLVKKVEKLLLDWKAPEGERRIIRVAEDISKLSPEQAYHLLNPEAYRREVEEIRAYGRWSKAFQFGRIVLGLAPLIITWGSISWAVLAYADYVALHSQDKMPLPPFLQLWQQGSLSGLTFFGTGVIDVALLTLFLSFSIYSLMLEYRARSESEEFATKLHSVTNMLIEAVAKEGRSEVASDAEIERIVKFIQGAIDESYQDLGNIVDKAKDTIVQTGETAKDMFDHQIKPLFSDFDVDVQNFHTDLHTLNDKVKDLVAASSLMSSAAVDMAASAANMDRSASDLAINVREQKKINIDMDAHLVDLNKTEKELAKDIRGATGELKQSAEKLQKAAEKVESLGKIITPQLVQETTDNAKVFADKTGEVATELQRVIQALRGGAPTPQGRAPKPPRWPKLPRWP